jgi:hypothetical protein
LPAQEPAAAGVSVGRFPIGKKDYDMTSGDLKRDELSFTRPDVKQRTKFTLDLRLEDGGVLMYGEQQDIGVWPDVRASLRGSG